MIDEETIQRAKKYSAKTGQNLSKIIENYLDSVTLPQQSNTKKFSPIIKRLMGSVKLPKDFNYKKTVEDGVKEKFKK